MLEHFLGWKIDWDRRSPKVEVSTSEWKTAWHDGGTGSPNVYVYQPKTRMLNYIPHEFTSSTYRKLNKTYPSLEAALKDVANHIVTYERWHTIIKVYPHLV